MRRFYFNLLSSVLGKNVIPHHNMNMQPTYCQLNLNSSKKTKYGTLFWKMFIKCQEHIKSKNLCRKPKKKPQKAKNNKKNRNGGNSSN